MNRIHRWYCRSGFWKRLLQADLIPGALEGADLGDDVLELGPGPGLSTDALRYLYPRVIAIEIDSALSAGLRLRLKGTNVRVCEGDATAMPFRIAPSPGRFASRCYTPSPHRRFKTSCLPRCFACSAPVEYSPVRTV